MWCHVLKSSHTRVKHRQAYIGEDCIMVNPVCTLNGGGAIGLASETASHQSITL